jgi:V-type H+-transporting ATPase subunit a
MFGDIGHGGVFLAAGIWMVKSEQAKKIVPQLYPIRFLLLMMGIFSFYSGWIYN